MLREIISEIRCESDEKQDLISDILIMKNACSVQLIRELVLFFRR